MNVLPGEDIPPQEPCQRCAEGCAKRAVIDTQRHAVDGCPEGPVRDRNTIEVMDLLPGLNNA